MNEATESVNVRFLLDGFDCMYTARTDQQHDLLLTTFKERLALLRDFGALPTAANGYRPGPQSAPPPDTNGSPPPADAPDCKTCGDNTHMQLVSFTDKTSGHPRTAWKCQHCGNWHWPNNKKSPQKGAKK